MSNDKFEEIKELVSQDGLQRTNELLDYGVIRLESLLDNELPGATKEEAEATLRTFLRGVREAADRFELAISEDDFWDQWEDKHDDEDDDEDDVYDLGSFDDDEDDRPYWGGSNECN